MKTKNVLWTATFILILIVSISCNAATPYPMSNAEGNLDDLEVQFSLDSPLVTGQEIPLTVEFRSSAAISGARAQFELPEGVSLSTGSLSWDLNLPAHKTVKYVVGIILNKPGVSQIILRVAGKPGVADTFEVQHSIFLSAGNPGPSNGKMEAPISISVAVSPEPVLGEQMHVRAWATALIDLQSVALKMNIPEGLSLASGASEQVNDLTAGQTMELNADILVEKQGEWPVVFEVTSAMAGGGSVGRFMTVYLQVGTSLGNTVTEFSESAINSTDQGQIERGTPMPPPTGSPEPVKLDGWVAPSFVDDPADPGERRESDPLPTGGVLRHIQLNLNEEPPINTAQKPETTQDDLKQVPLDSPGGGYTPYPDSKQNVPADTVDALSPGWNFIMTGTFEGIWPAGLWTSYDFDGATNGDYCWDDESYKPYNGSYSAWAAGGCANGVNPATTYYPNNARSYMVYGPFDLSDASDAELWFNYWDQSEVNYDWFYWMVSRDGYAFDGSGVSGDFGTWQFVNYDLSAYAGDSSVWIAFYFYSDASNVDDGPFVDDVTLWKYVPPGPLTVSGYWQYTDKNGVAFPVRDGRVEFYDADASGGDDLLYTAYTSATNGYYSAIFTNNDLDENGGVDLYIRTYTTDDFSANVRTGGTGNTIYFAQSPVENNLPNGTWDEGTWIVTDSNIRMAWYIYDKIAGDAWNYLLANAGWYNNYNLEVRWSPTSTDGSYYNGSYVALVAGDRWDEDVFLHEYGHFVMHKIYTTYPPTPNCNPHNWTVHSSLGCAWSEGWATFLQGAIQNSPAYIDTEDQSINYSMEPPSPWSDHPEDEGAVGASLWDIFDSAGEAWDTLANGVDEIWNLVYANDPLDVNGFRNLWYASAYGNNCGVGAILDHHVIAHNSPGYTLTKLISPVSSGSISANPGTNCVGNEYAPGTNVQVTGLPNAGYGFLNWSGNLSGSTNPNLILMNADKSITANFLALPGAFSKTSPANGATGQNLSTVLSWGSSTGATVYYYCIDTINDGLCNNAQWTNNGTNTSIMVAFGDGITYYWQVAANNAAGTTYANSGTWWSFTTGNTPAAFNKSGPANGATNQSLSPTLTWGTSTYATAYEYCYDTTNDNACSPWTSNGTSTSKALSGLGQYTTYYWHVRAINIYGVRYSDGNSPTAFWSFTTGGIPGAFNKSNPSNGATNQPLSLTLSWGSSSNATSYEYCYDTSNNSTCDGSWSNTGTSTSAPISGLSLSTTYYWHVRANNGFGTTYADSNTWWSFTTGNVPGAFNKSNPANSAANQPLSLTLSWSSSSNAASYDYCYDTSNNNSCDGSWNNTGTSTSAPISGLGLATTYYWHVRANNTFGSTYANGNVWWSFTTGNVPGAFAKSSPANSATNQPLSLTLTWGSSSNAASYEYCYDESNNNSCDESWTNTGTSTSAPISGLGLAKTYYWHVRANNSFGSTYADGNTWWSFTTGNVPGAFAKSSPVNGTTNQPLSLTLTWGSSTNAASYDYCYDTSNNNSCDSSWNNTGTSTSAPISGLALATTYYWHVRANNSFGSTYADGNTWWSFTTADLPGAFNKTDPVNGATNQSTSPTLTWASSANATSYEYCYDTTNDNACSTWTSNGTATSKALSGLSQNTTYYWHVRALNGYGTRYSNGSSTAFWSFTTGSLPGVFGKSYPTNGATNQPINLTLTWESSSNATSYEYCYDSTNDNACSAWTSNGTSTSKALSGLNANTTYYWHVRAVNSIGTTYSNGSSIASWSFKTSPPPGAFNKSAPVNNALKQSTDPTLKWGTSLGATSYEYCYDTIYNNTCDTSWANTTITSATLSSLNFNTIYYWQVRAVNTGGTIEANAGVWWTFKVVIAPPTLTAPLNGDKLLNNRPTFDWDDVPGATGYTIQISRNTNFSPLVGTYLVTPSSYTPTVDLPANTTLYWRVQSRGVNGPSAWSASRSINTANPPGVPALLLPANNALTTDYTPRLDWAIVTVPLSSTYTFHHYQIQVADNTAFTSPVIDDSSITTITAHEFMPGSDLTPNTIYYWRVRAYNTNSEYSSWSLVRKFRTALLPPTLSSPANGTNLPNRRPTFSWGAVSGATGYTIRVYRNSTFTLLLGSYSATSATYTPTADLPANVTLWWRVQSKGLNGPSVWSAPFSMHTANPPSIPVLLLPANNALTTDYTPRLDWSNSTVPAPTVFQKYEVQLATDSAFTAPTSVDVAGLATNSEYTPGADLNPNTTYYWRVRAYNASSEYSSWSLVRKFRTAITTPVLLTPADGDPTTNRKPIFDWADVTGAKNYTIQVSRNSTFTSLVVNATVTPSTYTPTINLPVGTLYWRVKANGANGPSLWSSPSWSFTIIP
jgi:hypothetical protein